MSKHSNPDLNSPFAGEQAYELIVDFLDWHNLTYTGGCRAFYTPEQWTLRGDQFGEGSVLIVVHDGGDLASVFNGSYGSPLFDQMAKRLERNGYYAESLSTWATAIYKNHTP